MRLILILIENMHKENHDLVTPVITKLKEDIVNINNELAAANNDYEIESSLKEKLLNNAKDLGIDNVILILIIYSHHIFHRKAESREIREIG